MAFDLLIYKKLYLIILLHNIINLGSVISGICITDPHCFISPSIVIFTIKMLIQAVASATFKVIDTKMTVYWWAEIQIQNAE